MRTGIIAVLSVIVFLSTLYCNDQTCSECISPAFKIEMVDSTGKKLNGFTLLFIDSHLDTTIVNDTLPGYSRIDSAYSIFGGSGSYTIEITKDNYDPISLINIMVTENRCKVNNTRCLQINPIKAVLLKSISNQYKIVKDSIAPGCGS